MIGKTVGETAVPQAYFTDADNVAYDPNSVSLHLIAPDGAESFPTPIQVGTGTYQFPFIGTEKGVWRGWVHGDGPDANIVIEPFSVCFVEEA